MITDNLQEQFTRPLLEWFDLHGRKNLPWQSPRTPYRVWVSEIMLQQTQVKTVIPYFTRFIDQFPTIHDLAQASEDEVLSLWSGLGYYSRGRNLHLCAKMIIHQYQGIFPTNLQSLMELPGIGPSTAAAIISQAFDQPTAILDGNVKRVLSRFFRIEGWPEQAQVKKIMWEYANSCMPMQQCADYTQAIMDLGALCCTTRKPNCNHCPLQNNCQAFKNREQHLFPAKKIKKPVPTCHQQLLVLSNDKGLIYLEKRPPSGLWGGLWCLPGLEKDRCPLNFLEQQYALIGDTPVPLIAFKHKFSHFHLEINALSIQVKAAGHQLREPEGQWFSKEQFSSLGLAKPTSVILSRLYQLKET